MVDNIDARVLIVNKNFILLVLEKEKPVTLPNGESFIKSSKWGMPGGRGEPGDKDPADTAWRETKEETNLSVLIDEGSVVKKEMGGFTRFAFLGELDPNSKTIKINPDEIIDCRWFPTGVVHDPNFKIYPDQRQMAQELLELKKSGE